MQPTLFGLTCLIAACLGIAFAWLFTELRCRMTRPRSQWMQIVLVVPVGALCLLFLLGQFKLGEFLWTWLQIDVDHDQRLIYVLSWALPTLIAFFWRANVYERKLLAAKAKKT